LRIGTVSNDLERPIILISHDIERRAVSLRQLSSCTDITEETEVDGVNEFQHNRYISAGTLSPVSITRVDGPS